VIFQPLYRREIDKTLLAVFNADIQLPTGDVVVAQLPEYRGSMKRCPARCVARVFWLSKSNNRSANCLIRGIGRGRMKSVWLAINTGYPIKLVGEAIANDVIKEAFRLRRAKSRS